MTVRAGLRSIVGLAISVALLAALCPRRLPATSSFGDPAARATDLVAFGLRGIATGLAAYVALVLLAVLLASARLLPVAACRLVERWTESGLAAGIRRLAGASALAIGLLPHVAAAAESPPILAPAGEVIAEDPGPTLTPTAPEPNRPPSPTGRPEAPERPGPTTLIVSAGDSFWTIAEALTTLRVGRPPTAEEVIGPWSALIAANRDRLVDPTDPDLLYAGQVLRLPSPASGP